ncbi:hypothetical protein AVEN_174381-1 [Araneus ventricosus]|uniref:Uncharacterized protein n=1 Tax=Araneus ventricosus TaxID=182803 RepID=A0A4Y2S8Q0_ARAVE|nr:hypothetical protein AVEN_174381-1 [Araneus ventricosus]
MTIAAVLLLGDDLNRFSSLVLSSSGTPPPISGGKVRALLPSTLLHGTGQISWQVHSGLFVHGTLELRKILETGLPAGRLFDTLGSCDLGRWSSERHHIGRIKITAVA